MVLDDTLLKIFTQIKNEIRDKYKVDYSTEEIQSIVETQLEATRVGIAKGISINWHRFCKFVFTNKYKRKLETSLLKNTLECNDDLTQEQKDEIIYNQVIENARQQKNHMISAKNIIKNQSTVESLINTPNVNNVTVKKFICLTKSRKPL